VCNNLQIAIKGIMSPRTLPNFYYLGKALSCSCFHTTTKSWDHLSFVTLKGQTFPFSRSNSKLGMFRLKGNETI